MLLSNRTAVLTGGGRGIGREVAKLLTAEGAKVILLSRTESELAETAALLPPGQVEYHSVDVSNEESVNTVVSAILSANPRIDILINNAGVQAPIGLFHETSPRDWKKNIEINLFGSVYLTHALLPVMIKQKYGKIINMSGGGSTSPRPNFSAYAVAKTGIVRLTENLAVELKEYNIDVNAVAPGAVNTRMLQEVLDSKEAAGKEFGEAQNRKEKGGTDPMVPASLICFLASADSDGVTGKLISAPWDPWKDSAFIDLLKTNNDIATLRRIDNKTFYKKS